MPKLPEIATRLFKLISEKLALTSKTLPKKPSFEARLL
jgi:hypothetical protein